MVLFQILDEHSIIFDDMKNTFSENNKSRHNKTPSAKFQINTHSNFEPEKLVEIILSKTDPQIVACSQKIELTSSEIQVLKYWIKSNYDVLMQFWNLEIDAFELGKILYK